MRLVSTTHTSSKATPINDNNYSCHIHNSCRTCLTNHMGSISRHIMPLVINSLGGGHTHINTHTDIRTETILRNQAHAGLWPACAWFNKSPKIAKFLTIAPLNIKLISFRVEGYLPDLD